LRGYLETGNKKRKGPAADVGASVEASGLHRTVGTLCADTHPGAYSGQDAYTGRLIPVSHWEGGDIHPTLNQAHNIGSPGYSNQELFSQKGAGLVPTPFRKSKRACSTTDNETWVPADASNTLNNFDLGDTRTTHAVVQPIAWTQNQREEVRLLGDKVGAIALPGTHQTNYIAEPVHQMPGSVAPTIGASGPPYSRTGNERVEAEALAVTFQPGNLRREAGADPSFTTTTTLKASAGDQTPHVATPMAVRRLTPVECERLQGFPDNWSRIPWKGKPETECPDGPRYKACGNSMAVPVMRWIGERIAAVDCTLSPHA
jgi:DNA (cytosine-5)-methyltransferase 1